MHEIKSVMFDLAGTLCSLSGLKLPFNNFLTEFVGTFGVQAEPEDIEVSYATGLMNSFLTVGKQSYYLHDDLFAQAIKNFLGFHNVNSYTDEDIRFALKNQRELTIGSIKVRSAVHKTLQLLRDRGIKIAVVSNIDEDYFHPMLEKLELTDKADVFLSSQAAKSCKPDQAIFLKGLELINLSSNSGSTISAPETIFVGDTPFADIKGANSVSMVSVLLKTSTMKAVSNLSGESKPDWLISSVDQILDIVDSFSVDPQENLLGNQTGKP